jgi:hypothetical protein
MKALRRANYSKGLKDRMNNICDKRESSIVICEVLYLVTVTLFWDGVPYNPVEFTNILEEYAASFFRIEELYF